MHSPGPKHRSARTTPHEDTTTSRRVHRIALVMNSTHPFDIGPVPVGRGKLFLIAGPCVIESETHARTLADAVQRIAGDLRIPYVFKASYDNANRTSIRSFRGPGLIEGAKAANAGAVRLVVAGLED